MAGNSLKDLSKLLEDKTKLGLVLFQKFINERNPREKQMISILGLLGILFLDYWLLIQPVVKIFSQNMSQSQAMELELRGLKEDKKNEKFIEKNWNQAKLKLMESEKRFITPNEMPTFLENISKLALDSGVKVIMLQPVDRPDKIAQDGKKEISLYMGALFKMSAVGGTHEFGKFLSWLETNPTFIKVTEIKISPNSADDRKHILELSFEVYRKEALK